MATRPALSNLLEWFEFNETSGNRTGSHNSIVLTENGTVSYATGKQGNCADFPISSTQYFSRAAPNSGLDIGAGSYTVTFWMRPESVLDKPDYNDIWKNYSTQSTGGVYVRLSTTAGYDITAVAHQLGGSSEMSGIATTHSANFDNTGLPDNWYFVAAVHDLANTTVRIYSDISGSLVEDSSYDYSGDIIAGSPGQTLAIGTRGDTVNPYDGFLDELTVWDTNLSADELDWLYNDGLGRSYSDMTALFPVGEVTGTIRAGSIIVYADSTEQVIIADFSSIAEGAYIETDEHGYGFMLFLARMSMGESFRIYDQLPAAHIVASINGHRLFEGRIEDRSIITGGLQIGAYGYQNALRDTRYTALWSTKRSANFTLINEQDIAIWTPSKYYTEIHPRSDIFISLKKNEAYAQDADIGGVFFRLPHLGSRSVAKISFSYDLTLPTGWRFDYQTADDDFSNPTSEGNVTGNDGNKTGSVSDDTITANREMVIFSVYNDTAANPYTNAGETDDWYVLVYNLRVQTTTSANVYADEIVDDLISAVNSVNSSQLSSSTSLVDSPAVDLTEAVFEDMLPADILNWLAQIGDSSNNLYEWGVWEGQKLHFRQRGSAALDWYVDAENIEVSSTLDTLINSAYAIYRDTLGQERRTADNSDAASIAKYGITRERDIAVASVADAPATTWRDTYLERYKDVTPRAIITFDNVYNATGGKVPNCVPRAGDTITIRNAPPGGDTLDKIRKFTIARTRYYIDEDRLEVTPELDLPSVEYMLGALAARRPITWQQDPRM